MLMHFPKMQREGIPGHEVNIFFIIGGKRSIFTISLLGRIPENDDIDAGLSHRIPPPRQRPALLAIQKDCETVTVYALCLASHAFFWDATE